MPINKEVTDFAETMTSVIASKATELGSSNFWRNQTTSELLNRINHLTIDTEEGALVKTSKLKAKSAAIEIAIAAMHIWQKL